LLEGVVDEDGQPNDHAGKGRGANETRSAVDFAQLSSVWSCRYSLVAFFALSSAGSQFGFTKDLLWVMRQNLIKL
jgi:hypothetical protein